MQIDPQNVTILAGVFAFVTGLLSFVSPCVLPLVPAYIGYLSGAAVTPEGVIVGRRDTMLNATAFVLGFSAIFVALGASIGLIGYLLQDNLSILIRAGGILLVVFGLRVAGIQLNLLMAGGIALLVALGNLGLNVRPMDVRLIESLMLALVVLASADLPVAFQAPIGLGAALLNWVVSPTFIEGRVLESALIFAVAVLVSRTNVFYMDTRVELNPAQRTKGLRTSVLMGLIFGAGWTPCVSTNLSAIFALASVSQTVGVGAVLLAIYSLGLAIPFLMVGAAFGVVTDYLRRLRRYLPTISLINGMLLVFMGVLLLSNRLAFLASYGSFLNFAP